MHTAMITILFILPTVLGYWFHGQLISGVIILILVPLFIWLLIYMGYVIACWFYNKAVPLMGGIEVDVEDMDVQPKSMVKTTHTETGININRMDLPAEEKRS